MYSYEDRTKAVKLLILYDLSYADTVSELGYPTKEALRVWYKEYIEYGELHRCFSKRQQFTIEQKQAAIGYYLEHGKNLARTVRAMGYPSKQALSTWLDALMPGQRKICHGKTREGRVEFTFEQKKAAVVDLCARKGPAKEVADAHGTSREALYRWKHGLLSEAEVAPAMPGNDKTSHDNKPGEEPFDPESAKAEIERLKQDIFSLQMEYDILQATIDVVKKDPSVDSVKLSNREKTLIIGALRHLYPLKMLIQALSISSSSYYYQVNALTAPDKYAGLRLQMHMIWAENQECYGYRPMYQCLKAGSTYVSEKVVRRVMAEEGLCVRAKKTKRYNSYQGEITPAPDNIINRDFHASAPNEKWVTDVTEFRIPAGKVYLSPIIDCFDQSPIAWSIGTSPSSELTDSSLENAISMLKEGERPLVHSDRGCTYRAYSWIGLIESNDLIRSMSAKGCSPDNAACEGYFGRLKLEFFYGRDWRGVTTGEFIGALDDYLHWYNEKRIKKSLGWLSPMQYRISLGLAA